MRSMPSSIFTTIISMAMMASSTRRPSARMSAPSVMRSKNAAGFQHDDEHGSKRQRNGRRDDDADAPAEAEQAHQHHDAERHRELHHELVDRGGDVDGLIADLCERHAERQALRDRGGSLLQRLAEFEPVPALLHHHAEHDGGFALMADEVGRGDPRIRAALRRRRRASACARRRRSGCRRWPRRCHRRHRAG